MQRHITCLLFAFVCALTAAPAWAQEYQLLQTINPDLSGGGVQDADPGPQFGYALSASRGILLIGMPWFVNSENLKRGAADEFHFEDHEWYFEMRLTGLTSGFQDARCGSSVAVSEQGESNFHKYVGCPFADYEGPTDTGFARIWGHHNGGSFVTLAAGEIDNEHMGYSVDSAYLGDGSPVYAVGARGGDYAQVGRPGGASEYAAVLGGTMGESFGYSVSIAAGGPQCCPVWLAVGAPGWNTGRGKVYVYYYHRLDEEWRLADELTAPMDPQPGDNFGASVLYHPGENLLDPGDDLLAIGAPARKTDGSTSASVATRGTVSVFRHGAQTGTFVHHGDVKFSQTVCNFEGQPEACDDTNQHMNFGRALAVDGFGNLWIGAPRFDQGAAPEVGRVYRARWGEATPTLPLEGWWVRSMLSPGPLGDDCGFIGTARSGGRFGWALATLPGAAIAVGYPQRGCQALTFPPSDPGPRRGQVRIYGIPNGIFADRFEE